MIKTLFRCLPTLVLGAAASGWAVQEGRVGPLAVSAEQALSTVPAASMQDPAGFFYFRFLGTEYDLADPSAPIAGFGLGYRRIMGEFAADISANGVWYSAQRSSQSFWTVPRVSYLVFADQKASRSVYAGAGLAWGGLKHKRWEREEQDEWDCGWREPSYHSQFVGIIPSVTCGYQIRQGRSILGFMELTASQPALAVERKGSFPGPVVEFSLGIGF